MDGMENNGVSDRDSCPAEHRMTQEMAKARAAVRDSNDPQRRARCPEHEGAQRFTIGATDGTSATVTDGYFDDLSFTCATSWSTRGGGCGEEVLLSPIAFRAMVLGTQAHHGRADEAQGRRVHIDTDKPSRARTRRLLWLLWLPAYWRGTISGAYPIPISGRRP